MKDSVLLIVAAGLVAAVGFAMTRKGASGSAPAPGGVTGGGSPDRILAGQKDLSRVVDTDEGRVWLDVKGNPVYFMPWGWGLTQ